MAGTTSPDPRRASGPQAPLAHELPRERLLVELKGRFERTLTVLIAGAGFGKTTVLSQAVRANLSAPVGIDAWVTCDVADEHAHRLALAIAAAVERSAPTDSRPSTGSRPSGAEPLDVVLDAFQRSAPVDVCLILDDLHRIPPDSGGHRLIEELLDTLPVNGHVLLAGRYPPPFALARLRASAEAVDIGESELGFSVDEVSALASLHGHDRNRDLGPGDLDDLGGWPALVGLSLAADRGYTTDFLWEEIVTGLDPVARRALLAMATLGYGSIDDAVVVDGGELRAADVHRIIGAVPLIGTDLQRRTFQVHDLWGERLDDLFPADEVEAARSNTRALVVEQADYLRLGELALRWADDAALRQAARGLVSASLLRLPLETARRWLNAARPAERDSPELRLLLLAIEVAEQPAGVGIDRLADELIGAFRSRDDTDGVFTAATLGVMSAHRRIDVARVFAILELVRSIPGFDYSPTLSVALRAGEAALASLNGGAGRGLEILEPVSLEDVSPTFADFAKLVKANWLMEVGRTDEAVQVMASLAEPTAWTTEMSGYVRWQTGELTEFIDRSFDLGDLDSLDSRSRFIRCTEMAEVAASLGDRATARSARNELTHHVAGPNGVSYSAAAAAIIAKTLVLEGDEAAARAVIDDHLARFPIDDPIGDLQLRRRFATVHLLHPELSERWDRADLGPTHRAMRDIAHLLGRVRRGERIDQAMAIRDPGLVVTSLPLPWSVELVVAAHRDELVGADALVDGLAGAALGPVRHELRQLAATHPFLASAAEELLTQLPHEDGPVLRVNVLGPMSITVDGEVLDRPQLRRARVRTALSLLVLRGPLRREELMDYLWPEHAPHNARQSLRTTLTHLRRLLEPPEGEVDQPRRLRTDGELVSLARNAGVEVDLWQFRRLMAAADDHADRPGGRASADHLGRAVELWRGDPLPDIEAVVGLEADVEQVRAELVDAGHRLSELLHTVGRYEEALACVERTLRASPYSERAHRLAISALLQSKDRDRLRVRTGQTRRMLDDLGVDPEPATAMLLARAEEHLGTVSDNST